MLVWSGEDDLTYYSHYSYYAYWRTSARPFIDKHGSTAPPWSDLDMDLRMPLDEQALSFTRPTVH